MAKEGIESGLVGVVFWGLEDESTFGGEKDPEDCAGALASSMRRRCVKDVGELQDED